MGVVRGAGAAKAIDAGVVNRAAVLGGSAQGDTMISPAKHEPGHDLRYKYDPGGLNMERFQ